LARLVWFWHRSGTAALTRRRHRIGYSIRRTEYSTILNGGGTVKVAIGNHLQVGVGGQVYVEPEIEGNRFAPYNTPGVDYEDFVRGEVAQRFLEENPGMEDFFPRPIADSSSSQKAIAYLGFGGLGPLRWNNFFANHKKLHPDNFVVENRKGNLGQSLSQVDHLYP